MPSNHGILEILVTTKQLTTSQAKQLKNHKQLTLATVLQYFHLNADAIAKALAAYFDYPYVDLRQLALASIPFSVYPSFHSKQKIALPIKMINNNLQIAVADPSNFSAVESLQFQLNYEIELVIVSLPLLNHLINQCRGRLIYQAILNTQPPTDQLISDFIEQIFIDAIIRQASDIHIEPYDECCRIRMRIDGLLQHIISLPITTINIITSRLKILAGLDITEQRRPQDGRFNFECSNHSKRDCRLSTCPILYGEKLVIRLLQANQQALKISSLGMSTKNQQLLESAIQKPQGLILVTGPTGSGKTNTLYAAISAIACESKNICSIENPVEIALANINQININPSIGLTFANALRTLLRQDPDVIMIGEIRDTETARIAIHAAQTGHLVFSTLHTNSAIESIIRLLNMGIETYNLIGALTLIVAQRLVRKTCQCQSASNCKKCYNGYLGRTGIFECLAITKDVATVITNSPSSQLLERLTPMLTNSLWQAAIAAIEQGITDIDEVKRIAIAEEVST